MDEEIYDDLDLEVIEKQFEDTREIKGKASEKIQQIPLKYDIFATVYETKTGALISLGMQNKEFTNDVMDRYLKLGEELYQKSNKLVCIYVICSPHVEPPKIRTLPSAAKVIIKLSRIDYNMAYETYRHIKGLVDARKKLNSEDLNALSMIPTMGPPEDKRNLRMECLELWKIIVNKGLIE